MIGDTPKVPDQSTLLLHAYADGELDPANALAMQRRIADDPQLAGEFDRIATLKRVLTDRLPPEPLPPGLDARIRRAVRAAAGGGTVSRRALATSIAAAAVLSSAATWLVLQPQARNATTEEVLANHVRGLMVPPLVAIASSDRHVVKPWFNGRVPHAPRVVDLVNDDFPLVGGRIDVVDHKVVPTLVYRHRRHMISLTAVPGTAARAPRVAQGYNIVTWTAEGVGYWAVSDLGAGDLNKFAELFQSAPADR